MTGFHESAPDSLSAKAKKARDYGIPIVSEAWLRTLLDGIAGMDK